MRNPEQLKAALAALAVQPRLLGIDRASGTDVAAVATYDTGAGVLAVRTIEPAPAPAAPRKRRRRADP